VARIALLVDSVKEELQFYQSSRLSLMSRVDYRTCSIEEGESQLMLLKEET
jgi:hypothetical protein